MRFGVFGYGSFCIEIDIYIIKQCDGISCMQKISLGRDNV